MYPTKPVPRVLLHQFDRALEAYVTSKIQEPQLRHYFLTALRELKVKVISVCNVDNADVIVLAFDNKIRYCYMNHYAVSDLRRIEDKIARAHYKTLIIGSPSISDLYCETKRH